MLLKPADIKKFQGIWHREFGETISAARAEDEALRLIELYTILARNMENADATKQE